MEFRYFANESSSCVLDPLQTGCDNPSKTRNPIICYHCMHGHCKMGGAYSACTLEGGYISSSATPLSQYL